MTHNDIIVAVRNELAQFCEGDERLEEFNNNPILWMDTYAHQITDRVVFREDFNRWCPPTSETAQERLIELFEEWS